MRIQDRQHECQREKDSRQPGGEFDQDVGGLSAENIFGYAPTECRTKSFALGTLHQDHEDHQQRDQDVDRQQEVNQDLHRGRGIWTKSRRTQPVIAP